jgi:hypothetical protein
MATLINDLYCEICELQFDKKVVFNIHLSFVHGKNQLNIKEEVPLCEDKSINLVTNFWAPSHEKHADAGKSASATLEILKISKATVNPNAKYVTETQSTSQKLDEHDSTLEFINSIEFCDEVIPKLETTNETFEPDNDKNKESIEIEDLLGRSVGEFQNPKPSSGFQSTRFSSSLEIFAVQPKAITSTSSNSLKSKSSETEIEIIEIQKTSDTKTRQKDYLLPTKNTFKYLKYQDGLLFCRLCSESFSSKPELINHIKKWENGGCGNRNKSAQPYIDKDIMDLEVNTPSTILCPLCNKFLKFKSQLPIHFKENHGSEPICTFCMKVFQSREKLSEHILITSCFDRHQRRKKKVQNVKIIDLDRPNAFNEEASLKKQKTSDVEIVDLD